MLIYQGQFGGLNHWATEVRIVQLKIHEMYLLSATENSGLIGWLLSHCDCTVKYGYLL